MSDRPKAEEAKASSEAGSQSPAGENGSSRTESQQLNDLLLDIVEREIGRGEARRAEDWARLHALAVGHPGTSDLVTTLEGVIQQCNQEMTVRFGSAGMELAKIRESVAQLVRVSMIKKLGLSAPAKAEEAKISPAGGSGASSGKNGSSQEQNQQLSDLLLGIMEREIGRGEPRQPQDWARLHALAAGRPGTSDLVTTLEGVIQECNQEMISRFGSAGIDLSRIRQSVVQLIRVSLFKKLGLSEEVKTKES